MQYEITEEQFGIVFEALRACAGPGGAERHAFLEALQAWGKRAAEAQEEGKKIPHLSVERGYLRGLKTGMLHGFARATQREVALFYEAAKILKFGQDWKKCAPRLPEGDDVVLDGEEAVVDPSEEP